MNELSKHIDQINKLCALNNVKSLFAFGSILTNKFNDKSDIDLLIDIAEEDPIAYSENYFNIKFQLEKIFNRSVDLLELRAMRNPYLKQEIDRSKVLLYGK